MSDHHENGYPDHTHKKLAHVSFEIRQRVQIWIEENCNGGYNIVSKNDTPGCQPTVLQTASQLSHARVLMDMFIGIFRLNTIEGTLVDVMELKKSRKENSSL